MHCDSGQVFGAVIVITCIEGATASKAQKNSAQISATKRRSIVSTRPLHNGAAAVTLTNSFVRLTPGINGKFKTL